MTDPNRTTDDLRIEPLDEHTPASGAKPTPDTRAQHEDNWARDALLDLAREGLMERRRARRWQMFFRLLGFGIVIWLIAAFTLKVDHSESGALNLKQPTAAIIDIRGIIAAGQDASAEKLIPILEKAFKAPQIKGIVLRMNTPGGSPVQAGQIYDAIMRLRKEYPAKPIYAVTEDICASGGYYIAAAADKIYADKASLVGSIGVRMDGFGFVGAMHTLGIESRLLTSGANKAMLDPFTPENPAQVQYMQKLLDAVHQQFIDAVKQGRGNRLSDDPDLFSGLIYTGDQAVKNGLVDGLGTVRSVVHDQFRLQHEVDLTPHKSPLDRLLSQTATEFGHSLMGLWAGQIGPKLLP